jgi:hypothetical protein
MSKQSRILWAENKILGFYKHFFERKQSMKWMQIVLVLLGSMVLLMGGCTNAGEGSSFNYASGNLSATLGADLQKSYDASLKALDQLQLVATEKSKDALGAKIISKTAADKKITISLTRVTDATTSLVIGVGMTGDKTTSSAIYSKILENLKK